MSDTDVPLLSEVLEAAVTAALDDVRTTLPGRIVDYDAVSRRATVQPLVTDRVVGEDGRLESRPIAPLTDVPVMRVGSDAERIKLPVKPGDQVLLSFASSSIAVWKSSGDLVDPKDDRRHHLADAIAILGLGTGGDPAAACIDIDQVVKLGSSAAVASAMMAEAHTTALTTLVTAIASAVAGIPTGGAAAASAITAALATFNAAAASFTATKVKVI